MSSENQSSSIVRKPMGLGCKDIHMFNQLISTCNVEQLEAMYHTIEQKLISRRTVYTELTHLNINSGKRSVQSLRLMNTPLYSVEVFGGGSQ